MSTDKSLKHLKSNDKLFIANVLNYFEKHLGRDSSSYSGNWGQQKNCFPSTKKNYEKPLHFRRPNVRNGDNKKTLDDIDEVVIRNNVHEFYTHRHSLPTINNLLSVLKTDIMSTIHQN